jgi:hypothetical protein
MRAGEALRAALRIFERCRLLKNKIGGESSLLLFQRTTDLKCLKFYFLAVLLGAGDVAFLATFLAGAFF